MSVIQKFTRGSGVLSSAVVVKELASGHVDIVIGSNDGIPRMSGEGRGFDF